MSQSLTGSRYEMHLSQQGAVERKAHAYYEIHPADVEEDGAGGDDLVGYVHSWEVGSTVDGPRAALRRIPHRLPAALPVLPQPGHLAQAQRPAGDGRACDARDRQVRAGAQDLPAAGVTLSGGEPMVQRAFMSEIFRRCKALGLHTCVDTAGRLGDRLSDAELMNIDLQLLDIKSGDPQTYERVTRQPLQPTLDYAHRLARSDARCGCASCSCRADRRPGQRRRGGRHLRAARSGAAAGRGAALPPDGQPEVAKLGLEYPLAGTEAPTPS
jgi:pyruvate formate lyase activating enzyme